MAEGAEYSLNFAYNGQGMEKHVSRLGTVAGRASEKLKEMVTQKGYLYYSLKRIVTYTAIFTFYAALGKSIKDVIDLELALAEVNTLIDKTNADLVSSYKQVTSALLQLDPHLGNAIELTKGLYEIISAGVTDPAQAFELLVTSSKYAKVGLTDLATASSSLTAVMKAYGFTADTMRAKSDVLFASVREGKFHTDELNAAIGKILPTAASMNVSIEEIVSALAVMTQRGLDVNEASTSLNRMLLSFLRPIDKAKARFQALGWEYGRNAFQSISLTGALGRLEEASARYGDLIPVIFRRQRALRGAFILQGEGLRALESMYGRVTGATAGAGIVASEFEKISGTVALEVKALHANLLQGLSTLLQYKGNVASIVRELSLFLRGVMENLPAVLRFGSAILFVMRIMKTLRSEFIFTTIGQLAYNKALRAGKAAEDAKALATARASKVTKAAGMVLGWVNAVLIAALAAYVLVTYWINKKKKAEEDAKLAAEEHMKVQEEMSRKIGIMVEAWKIATGETHNFAAELELLSVGTDWLDRVKKKMWELANGPHWKDLKNALTDVKRETKLSGKEWNDAWYYLRKVTLGTEELTEVQRAILEPLLQRLAEKWGWTNEILENFRANLEKVSPAFKTTLMVMSKQMQAFARDSKMASSEMKTLTGQLALRYSEEELEAMAVALERMKAGLTDMETEQLRLVGIDVAKLMENVDEVTASILRFRDASKQSFGAQQAARIEDYARTAEASWDTIRYSQVEAYERARGLYTGFKVLRSTDTADHLAFAEKHKDEIDKIMRHEDGLLASNVRLFKYLMELREKDKKSNVDWAERYKSALNKMMDDTDKISSKIASIKNTYRDEEHENIIESFEREKISYLNHAYALMDIAIKSGTNQAEAARFLQERIIQVMEWGREAKKASLHKELQDFMKNQNDTLKAMKQPVAARLRTIEVMADKAIEYLDGMGDMEASFYEHLAKIIKDYWDEIRDATEAGIDSLKEHEQFFRALGTSITAVAGDLLKFFDAIGMGESILGRMARALGAVGEGASSFAQHLKLISESRDLSGKEGLDGILGTIGKIGGTIGAVVSIAQTAIGVFKALFGGKTDEQKAQDEADRKKREVDAMVSQMQGAYSHLGQLSESMAKKMAEMRQEGMEGWLVEAKLLNEIMSDIGITAENFASWSGKVVGVMQNMRDGFIGMEEGAGIVGDAFKQLTDHAKKFGTEGSRAILEMIWAARDMGLEIPEIAAYVTEKLNLAAAGLAKAIVWVAKGAVEAHEEIKKLTKEKKGLLREVEKIKEKMKDYKVGSSEYQEAAEKLRELEKEINKFNKEIDKSQELINAHGHETTKHIQNLSVITEATFSAMLASGRPLLEVMNEMKDSVFALMARYEALGLEVPAYLKPIFKIFKQFEKTPEFFEGLQGLQDAMKGLGDSGYMTVGAFKALNKEAKAYYTQMTTTKKEGGFGFADEQAIRMMYPMLQQMWWYAEQYGMKLPKWAKDAMKEAEKLGLKFEKPAVEQQIDLMEQMVTIQKKRLGRTVELLADIKKAIKGTDSFQLGTPHTQGGFAHLHPGESVLPENVTTALKQFFMGRAGPGMGGGGEGGTAEVSVYMDGQMFYRQMRPYIRKGAANADFEVGADGVY